MKTELIKRGKIEYVSSDTWEATGVEYLIDGIFQVKIPDGFIFDGASVPKIAKLIGIDDDNNLYCSLLHDFLYRKDAKIIVVGGNISNYNKYMDYISYSGKQIYCHGNRKFADLCYKVALGKGKWIKKRLPKRKILYSYYILRIFGGYNFRKKKL